MAYSKTNWVDNTTPIDKDNLNKIEQGIYDNSLVVDAVTNTLNPTDTETYKTAELTEGQITDVIGVNDILIKGQTSQDGTPTPSAPVDVNVVSGSNVINTSNKNILNLKKLYRSSSNVTYNFQTTNSVSASGTTAYNSFVFFMENKIKNNNYTLSFKMKELGISSKKKVQIIGNNSQTTTGSTTIQNKSLGTLTINTEITDNVSFNSGSYDYIGLVFWNNDSGTALSTSTIWNITEMQLEQSSTATTYEPHQGKELPLDLGSIELCKIGDYQDYFYKSGSKWYLHKEIGKTILNGTENWNVSSGSGFYRFILTDNNFKNDANLAAKNVLMSNIFKSTSFNARNTDYNETCYQTSNGATSGAGMGINTNIASTVNDFKTWLASNNVTVYYVLATPTDTEITGTLKEQLETIYNAPLYEQTNITQTNNDLPMVLDITACKDNINGIKAFIRK